MVKYFLYKNDLPDDFVLSTEIAVDTESMGLVNRRDRLCLVQISTGDDKAHLVKFDGNDYRAPNLKRMFLNSDVLKIFHFARFDIAIINYYLGIYPYPIYCTKVASRLCRTYTDRHSLRELCFELLGVNISKNQQSSDWGNENLTREQLAYASYDVLYLHAIKHKLDEMLFRESRYELAYACFEFLKYRAQLDHLGWEEQDIFSHKV